MSKNLTTENQKAMFFATKKGENLLTRLKQSINDSVDNPEIAQGVLNNLDNLLSFIKEKADEKIQRIKEDEVVIEALHKQLTTVERQYSYLNTLRKKAFGSMSEAEFSKKILESISKEAKKEQENIAKQEDLFNPVIFNEIEGVLEHNEAVDVVTTANENKEETKAKTKKRVGKAKGVKNNLSIEVLEELGVEVREDVLPHETHCPVCHEELKEMGSVVESTTLEYVPAKVILVKKIRKTMKCQSCEKDGIENNDAREYIFRSEKGKQPQLIPHSVVSPSLLTHIIYSKFCNAMTFYRLEKDMKNTYNIPITRGLMCSWASQVYDSYLVPLIDIYKEELLQQPAIHADETGILILKKKSGIKNSNSKDIENFDVKKGRGFMWVYSSTKWADRQICLFDYENGRGGKYPENYLIDFKGYIHTDAYNGYNKVKTQGRCLCWVHMRRKFIEACEIATIQHKNPELELEGIVQIDSIFKNERKYNLLTPEERYKLRLEETKPILDKFFNWCRGVSDIPLPGSKLREAINYSLENEANFYTFLKDGRLDISNNTAESHIRSFTIVRKNCLFCITESGAEVSASYTSIIATAKANNLASNKYLELLLERLPNIPGITKYSLQLKNWEKTDQTTPKPLMPLEIKEALQKLLPWNEEIQEKCLNYEAKQKKPEPILPELETPKINKKSDTEL